MVGDGYTAYQVCILSSVLISRDGIVGQCWWVCQLQSSSTFLRPTVSGLEEWPGPGRSRPRHGTCCKRLFIKLCSATAAKPIVVVRGVGRQGRVVLGLQISYRNATPQPWIMDHFFRADFNYPLYSTCSNGQIVTRAKQLVTTCRFADDASLQNNRGFGALQRPA